MTEQNGATPRRHGFNIWWKEFGRHSSNVAKREVTAWCGYCEGYRQAEVAAAARLAVAERELREISHVLIPLEGESMADAALVIIRQRESNSERAEKAERELLEAHAVIAEAKRRLLHIGTTNSDDYRWYKQQAQQACRAIGIEQDKLEWEP